MESKQMSVFDLFNQCQETYQDAKMKAAAEASQSSKHFRLASDGTYTLRILPNAPVFDQDGNMQPLDRKSYEYPIRSLVLKLDRPNAKGNTASKPLYASVCKATYAKFSVDLIDTYVAVATDLYGDDEKLVSKITSNSFDGGLKWDSQRVMYVLDAKKREDGVQLLNLTYSQYKDLEAIKLKTWEKLLKMNPQQPCPISSIENAYIVEITRKTENRHTKYMFDIDTLSGTDKLSEDELQELLDAPRIPDAIYRFTRWHLEAEIEFLKQYDEKLQINVMDDDRVKEAIEKLKLELPESDKSHFTFDSKNRDKNGGNNDDDNDDEELTIDNLFDRYNDLKEKGLNDKSEEGQELREDIRQYIEDNELTIRVSRVKSNRILLEEIEDTQGELPDEAPTVEKPKSSKKEEAKDTDDKAAEDEPDDEPDNDEDDEDTDDEDSEEVPQSPRNNERKESAATPSRRAARPERRRR